MAYVHTLKNSVKVGLHCEKNITKEDEQLLQAVCPNDWSYRNTAKDKRTIERVYSKDVSQETLADETERLKRIIRRYIQNTPL
jgi:hypothetical protein